MLRRRRRGLLMCGKGRLGGWERPPDGNGAEPLLKRGRRPPPPPLPPLAPGRVFCRGGWHPRRRGFSRPWGRPPRPPPLPPPPERERPWPRPRCCPCRPPRARVLLSLRPVNLMGRRVPGMRAPRNTNQFLMQEKYRLLQLRSDSVGTESGGSDCEMDPLDMDAYLGALENARGALLDGPLPPPALGRPPAPKACPLLSPGACEDDSLPYSPSEDDVIQSETFMERDFHEFCSSIVT